MVFVLFILQEIGIAEIECKAHQLYGKKIVAIFVSKVKFSDVRGRVGLVLVSE